MIKFTPEENEILYHAAKAALADADSFVNLAELLDVSDTELLRIRDKLYAYLTEEQQ